VQEAFRAAGGAVAAAGHLEELAACGARGALGEESVRADLRG
jgi:hypothetical protein